MALGRISGPLLKDDLVRNGVNLSFETDLLYLLVNTADSADYKVGIKNSNPAYTLDVTGTIRTTSLLATDSKVGNVVSSGQTITTYFGDLILDTLNHAGTITANSNVLVNGDLHATGNITADGNITLGNSISNDTVTFGAEITSSIIPKTNELYDLGSDPISGGHRWNHIYTKALTLADLTVTGTTSFNTLNVTNNATIGGDLAVNGGDITTTSTGTVSVFDTNATAINIGHAATAINIGTSTTNVLIDGNLTVNGVRTIINTQSLEISDTIVYLGTGNTANLLDIGFVGHFDNGTYQHTGLIRDHSDGTWKLFSNEIAEVGSVVDFSGVVYDPLKIGGLTATTGNFSGNLAVNSTKFTVNATTGNTAFTGDLAINSTKFTVNATTGNTAFTGDLAINSNKFTVAASTGNTAVAGTLNVTGHTTFEGVTSTGATGTGNIVYSISPTITGHITVEGVTATGATGTGKFVFDNTPTFTGTLTAATIVDSALTAGRVVFAGTNGLLTDSNTLTFSAGTLTVGTSIIAGGVTVGVANITLTGGNVAGATNITGSGTIQGGHLKDTSLTTGRVALVTTGGQLADNSNLTFDGTLLTVTGNGSVTGTFQAGGLATLAQARVSDLTSGRITYAGASGRLLDSSNLTFSGTKLTVTGDQQITGNLQVDGDVTIGGNIQIGNQTIDTVTVTADFTSDLVPKTTNTYNLGVSASRWKQLWANSLDILSNSAIGGTLTVGSDFAINTSKFTVDSATGNTVVAGTLAVTGHTTFEGVTSTGATGTGNLVYSIGPTFTGTLTASNITDSNLTAGRVTFAGNGGNLTDSGNFTYSSGTLTVGTSVIAGGVTVGVADITLTGGNITGVAGITATATVQAAHLKDTSLTSGRVALVTTGGQLADNSNLTFNGSLLAVTGGLTVSSDVAVNTNKFTVASATGNTLIAGTLDVTGSIAINTNKFTVDAATGRTFVAGTFEALGEATLDSKLFVQGDLAVNTNKFTVQAVTGNTAVAGTLNVTGHTIFEGVTSTGATGTGNIVYSISPTITGHITVEGVTATGATGTGNFVFANSPTINGHITVEGVTATGATGTGKFVFDNSPTITGHPTIEGITSTGATGTGNIVYSISPTITGTLAASAITASSTLDVTGLSTLATARVSDLTSGRITYAGTSGRLVDSGNLTFSGTKLTVTGDQDITGNLKVDGNITLGGNITIGNQTVDTITVTADFTSDLIPQADNTYNLGSSSARWKKVYANAFDVSGSSTFGNISIHDNIITAVNTDGGITLTPNGVGYVTINSNKALVIPTGNSLARPGTPVGGMVRYNNELNQFEGYSSGNWSSLGGVRSVDGKAYILAETSPGAADDILHFYAGATVSTNVGNWTDTALTILSPGFRVPVGNTLARPTGVDGYIRFNSEQNKFEGFSNGNWTSLGGVSSVTGSTYIAAEAYAGAGDNTLYFYANGVLQATIDPTKTDIKNLFHVSDVTNSISTITGSITTAGGVGIAKNLYVGANANIAGTFTAQNIVDLNPANYNVSLQPTGTGTVTINPGSLGSVDNMSVGSTTASTGRFTTLTATTSATFSPSGTVTINPTTASTMDNVSIGSTTRAPGAFTTLTSNGLTTFTNGLDSNGSTIGSVVFTGGVGVGKNLFVGGNINATGTVTAGSTLIASAAVQLNPANYNVSLQPTGTGTVTIDPTVLGSIDNMAIGATTASTAKFTTLQTSGNVTLNGNNSVISLTPTGAGYVVINPGALGTMDRVTVGGTTPAAGTFTNLTANTSASLSPTGTVTINPSVLGSIDNMAIGATTASTARVTNFTATASASLSPTGSVTINPGTTSNVDNVVIGANTARAGTFTNLTATTSASLSPTGSVTINPGTTSSVDNVNIGANTRGTGAFTSFTANGAITFTSNADSSSTSTGAVVIAGGVGIAKNLNVGANLDVTGSTTAESTFTANAAVNLNPSNNNVSLQPSGSGTVTIAPATAGTINNMDIGGTTPKSAKFTTLTTQGDVTLNGDGSVVNLTPTGAGYVVINPGSAGSINKMSIGATTPSTGKFTTLQATTSATFNTSGDVSIQPAGTATINPTTIGAVDNVNIGANTRGTGAFTSLTSNSTTTFTDSTQSTSTTSGAVQIAGGVGIVKNLFIGGDTNIAGNLTVLGTTTTIQSTVTTLTDPVIAVGGTTDTGLVDPADRGVQIRYAQDISSAVSSWTGDYSSSVVANLSVTAASLGLKLGDKVNISGSSYDGLDGVGTVTYVGSNTFTFTAPNSINYGTATNVATVGLSKNGFFGYHPTANKFVYIPDAVISSNVVSGNYGDAEFNSLTLVSALAVSQGGTGTNTFTPKGILFGNGSYAVQVTSASDMDGANATASYGILTTDSNNTPVWTDVIDCGTY